MGRFWNGNSLEVRCTEAMTVGVEEYEGALIIDTLLTKRLFPFVIEFLSISSRIFVTSIFQWRRIPLLNFPSFCQTFLVDIIRRVS